MKWWEDPVGMTYRALSVVPIPGLPDEPVVGVGDVARHFYGPNEKAVFFGHYWLTGEQALHRENVCCLDYNVAHGGSLVAYRFDGEARLAGRNFVRVGVVAG